VTRSCVWNDGQGVIRIEMFDGAVYVLQPRESKTIDGWTENVMRIETSQAGNLVLDLRWVDL